MSEARPRLPARQHFRVVLPELSPVWPYGLLLVLVLIFGWPMFLSGKVPFMRDFFFDFLPKHLFAKKVFLSGHLPFWNPYSGLGKPFIADPQTATFYPLHIVFYLLSPANALRIYCAAHLWLGGAAMFALARHWRLQIAPALVAAVGCMFSSWAIANLEFANNLCSAVWAPFIVLVASHIERTSRIARAADRAARLTTLTSLLALLLAIQYLAGFPEFVVYTAALAATYVIASCAFHRALKPLLTTIAILLSAVLLAVLVAAPQLLLSLEFVPLSERAAMINPGLRMASLQPHHFLQFLLPFINGRPGYPDQFWGGTIFEFWIGTCYVGVLPLLLGLFSFLVFRRGRSRRDQKFLCVFLFAMTVFGILMALGQNTPLYQFFYDRVPGFNHFRFPSKFLVLVLFAISLLAGVGCQEVLRLKKLSAKNNWVRSSILIAGLVIVAIFAAGYFFAAKNPEFFRSLSNGLFPDSKTAFEDELGDYLVAIVFLAASVGVIFVGTIGPVRLTAWAAPALVFANLFLVTRGLHPMVDQSLYNTKPPEVLEQLRGVANYRVHSVYGPVQQWLYASRDDDLIKWATDAGVGDTWLPFGINQTVQGGQKLARYGKLYYLLWSAPPDKAQELADLLSIRYTLAGAPFDQISWHGAPKTLQLVEHPSARPRAFLVGNWIFTESSENSERWASQILAKLLEPDFDITSTAIVERETSGAEAPVPPAKNTTGGDSGEVISFQDNINEVRVHVAAKTDALFVLNDACYPGWTATVDGVVQSIFRTNSDSRGVFLKPGEHDLRFVFAPKQFRIGLGIAVVTIILMSAVPIFVNRSRKKI